MGGRTPPDNTTSSFETHTHQHHTHQYLYENEDIGEDFTTSILLFLLLGLKLLVNFPVQHFTQELCEQAFSIIKSKEILIAIDWDTNKTFSWEERIRSRAQKCHTRTTPPSASKPRPLKDLEVR
ncbi:hypothetical protein J6590_059940, partial [Homalodisca vitripennis]